MSVQSVTVDLPGTLYNQLKRQAELSHRTVEAELIDAVASAMPVADTLSDELEGAVSALALLDDESLWRVARNRLSPDIADPLETLHLKRQREGLNAGEDETLAGLVRQYERVMLVRAEAARLLKERGHDVSALAAIP